MKAFVLIFIWMASFALADGGIGGFEGGAIVSKNGSIFFQDHSMFVNPAINKTLCLNADDQYQAYVGKTEIDYNGQVISISKGMVYQDRVSTKRVCADPNIELNNCPEFALKAYVQVPSRILLTPPDSNGRQKEFKYIIRRCD